MAKSDIIREGRIRKAAVVLLLTALAGAGQGAALGGESDSLRQLCREAREASMRGETGATIRYYRAALRLARQERQENSQAYCLNGLAEAALRQQEDLAQARRLLRQARALPAARVTPAVRARTLELCGHLDLAQERRERAAAYALEGVHLLETAGARDSMEIPNLYTLHGAACQQLGRYDDAIASFEASLRTRPAHDTTSPSALITKSILALSYATKGEVDAALQVIAGRVLCGAAVESMPVDVQEIVCSTLAHIEASKGLPDQALRHQLRALELATKLYSPNNPAIADFYRSAADRYAETGDYEMSLAYANRGMHIVEGAPAARRRALAACSDAKATALLGLGRPAEALQCAEQSIRLRRQSKDFDRPAAAWTEETRASVLSRLGRFRESLQANRHALALRRQSSLIDERYDIVRLLIQQGEILGAMHRFAEADSALTAARDVCGRSSTRSVSQRALVERSLAASALGRGDPLDALAHAEASLRLAGYRDSASGIRFPDLAVDALSMRSEAELLLAHGHPDSAGRQRESLASLDSAIVLSEVERQGFSDEATRIAHASRRAGLYERAVDLSLGLERSTGDIAYRYRALALGDRRKAWALRTELAERERWRKAGVTDSVLDELARLDRQIAAVTVMLERGTAGGGSAATRRISRQEEELFRLRGVRDSLLQTFPVSGVTSTALEAGGDAAWWLRQQRGLAPGVAIVSYFVGEGRCRVFVLTRDTLMLCTLAGAGTLRREVDLFRQATSTLRGPEALRMSRRLYRRLLRPIASVLQDRPHLVIVPDNFLGRVPFEALAGGSGAVQRGQPDFTRVSFLLRTHEISYAQSAGSYAVGAPGALRLSAGAAFAGYAPVFADSDRAPAAIAALRSVRYGDEMYQSLRYSAEEVLRIAEGFRAHGLRASCTVGGGASEGRFKAEAGRSSVIHLSTHGIVNDRKPSLSALLFAPQGDSTREDDGVLYAEEASAMTLQAELVVLGSCESGIGKLAGAEGMLAMSRAFFHAGARRVMYSLWPVGDRQTAQLMQGFYRGLLEGETYAGSLRKAKLKMLGDAATAFPSKWAGFVLMER